MPTDRGFSSDPRWAAQRLAAVGSIAGLVGHAARNRLTVVRAALELIEIGAGGDLTAEQGTAFLRELDRFLGDFNLGLEMIRCHQTGVSAVSVRSVVAEALALVSVTAKRGAVTMHFTDPWGSDLVCADPLLLKQSLLNLLRNALEALAGRADGCINVRSLPGEPWMIEVEDNGPGLPPDWPISAAGEPAASCGAGLGLVLCRDAMTVMGGTLSYLAPEAGTGVGPRFRLGLRPG